MTQTNKKYIFFIFSFLFIVYLFSVVVLSLLTTINSTAQYPLYNFLGSENDLEVVVLHLLPFQNPYHLQQWNSAPVLNLIISFVLFVLFMLYLVQLSKFIIKINKWHFFILFTMSATLAGFTFFPLYRSLILFLYSFFP